MILEAGLKLTQQGFSELESALQKISTNMKSVSDLTQQMDTYINRSGTGFKEWGNQSDRATRRLQSTFMETTRTVAADSKQMVTEINKVERALKGMSVAGGGKGGKGGMSMPGMGGMATSAISYGMAGGLLLHDAVVYAKDRVMDIVESVKDVDQATKSMLGKGFGRGLIDSFRESFLKWSEPGDSAKQTGKIFEDMGQIYKGMTAEHRDELYHTLRKAAYVNEVDVNKFWDHIRKMQTSFFPGATTPEAKIDAMTKLSRQFTQAIQKSTAGVEPEDMMDLPLTMLGRKFKSEEVYAMGALGAGPLLRFLGTPAGDAMFAKAFARGSKAVHEEGIGGVATRFGSVAGIAPRHVGLYTEEEKESRKELLERIPEMGTTKQETAGFANARKLIHDQLARMDHVNKIIEGYSLKEVKSLKSSKDPMAVLDFVREHGMKSETEKLVAGGMPEQEAKAEAAYKMATELFGGNVRMMRFIEPLTKALMGSRKDYEDIKAKIKAAEDIAETIQGPYKKMKGLLSETFADMGDSYTKVLTAIGTAIGPALSSFAQSFKVSAEKIRVAFMGMEKELNEKLERFAQGVIDTLTGGKKGEGIAGAIESITARLKTLTPADFEEAGKAVAGFVLTIKSVAAGIVPSLETIASMMWKLGMLKEKPQFLIDKEKKEELESYAKGLKSMEQGQGHPLVPDVSSSYVPPVEDVYMRGANVPGKFGLVQSEPTRMPGYTPMPGPTPVNFFGEVALTLTAPKEGESKETKIQFPKQSAQGYAGESIAKGKAIHWGN